MTCEPRLNVAFERLRKSMRLLGESLTSYEQHGIRSADKVATDARLVAAACWDVVVEIARRA